MHKKIEEFYEQIRLLKNFISRFRIRDKYIFFSLHSLPSFVFLIIILGRQRLIFDDKKPFLQTWPSMKKVCCVVIACYYRCSFPFCFVLCLSFSLTLLSPFQLLAQPLVLVPRPLPRYPFFPFFSSLSPLSFSFLPSLSPSSLPFSKSFLFPFSFPPACPCAWRRIF